MKLVTFYRAIQILHCLQGFSTAQFRKIRKITIFDEHWMVIQQRCGREWQMEEIESGKA
jgi:hypothetical protein